MSPRANVASSCWTKVRSAWRRRCSKPFSRGSAIRRATPGPSFSDGWVDVSTWAVSTISPCCTCGKRLIVIGRLAPSDGLKSLRGTLRSDLGDALRAGGHYADARKAYEAALKIAEELNDLRGQGVDLGRLGALALAEGNLEEARTRQQAALRLLQQLHEPEMEAAAWHQLGRIHHQQRQWDEAERHYREAARISEERGHLAAAAQTWNQLVVLAHDAGKPERGGLEERRQADHFRHPRPRRRVAELRQGRDSRTTGPLLPHGQAARSGRPMCS